jgi:PKD repeat protein
MTVAGQSASTTAVYPSANFTSAIITGSASLQASTAVTAFAIDADTDALVSATFTGKATTNTIASNVSLTVTEAGATGSGYYLKFSSPVPYGKIVTALIGFDQ